MKTNPTTLLKKILIATVLAFTLMLPQLFVANPAQAQPTIPCQEGEFTNLPPGGSCTIYPNGVFEVNGFVSPGTCPFGCEVDITSEAPDCNIGKIAVQFQSFPFSCIPEGNDISVKLIYAPGPLAASLFWQGR